MKRVQLHSAHDKHAITISHIAGENRRRQEPTENVYVTIDDVAMSAATSAAAVAAAVVIGHQTGDCRHKTADVTSDVDAQSMYAPSAMFSDVSCFTTDYEESSDDDNDDDEVIYTKPVTSPSAACVDAVDVAEASNNSPVELDVSETEHYDMAGNVASDHGSVVLFENTSL